MLVGSDRVCAAGMVDWLQASVGALKWAGSGGSSATCLWEAEVSRSRPEAWEAGVIEEERVQHVPALMPWRLKGPYT